MCWINIFLALNCFSFHTSAVESPRIHKHYQEPCTRPAHCSAASFGKRPTQFVSNPQLHLDLLCVLLCFLCANVQETVLRSVWILIIVFGACTVVCGLQQLQERRSLKMLVMWSLKKSVLMWIHSNFTAAWFLISVVLTAQELSHSIKLHCKVTFSAVRHSLHFWICVHG